MSDPPYWIKKNGKKVKRGEVKAGVGKSGSAAGKIKSGGGELHIYKACGCIFIRDKIPVKIGSGVASVRIGGFARG
jgi:hypothetical protein